MEMEQSLARLAKELLDEKRTGVQWISAFVRACDWFEKQVVSALLLLTMLLLTRSVQVLLQSWLAYLDRVYVLQDAKLCSVQ
jgi:hypothetical protein